VRFSATQIAVFAACVAILLIGVRAMGIPIPEFAVQIGWVLVVLAVVVGALMLAGRIGKGTPP
jgi:hypothetical protein